MNTNASVEYSIWLWSHCWSTEWYCVLASFASLSKFMGGRIWCGSVGKYVDGMTVVRLFLIGMLKYQRSTPAESPQLKSFESPGKTPIHADATTASQTGCGICSTWPRTFAFVAALGLLCATVIIVPIVLTNTLGLGSQKTSTGNRELIGAAGHQTLSFRTCFN